MKIYRYEDFVNHIKLVYGLDDEAILQMPKLKEVRQKKLCTMSYNMFLKAANGYVLAYFRHTNTRYEKALKGGRGINEYEKLKKKYTREAIAELQEKKLQCKQKNQASQATIEIKFYLYKSCTQLVPVLSKKRLLQKVVKLSPAADALL